MAIKALTFSRHALILGVLTMAIYLVFALLSYQQYQDARKQLRASDQQTARAELHGTVRKAMADLLSGVDRLSQWDELYQQLRNPTYYVYWYAHRIRGSGSLDSRFSDLMLYDAEGQPLSVFDDSSMPLAVDPDAKRERYEIVDGDVRVTLIVPLRRDGENRVLGHLAVQAFLLPSIQRLHAFNLVDAGTLSFSAQGPLEDTRSILTAARFELLPTRHFALVDGLVGDVVITLGLLVALPSLLLVIFFIRFVGRAVKRVPTVIDLLRDSGKVEAGEIERELDRILPGLKISELRSAERSLIEYHNELSSANAVLEEKSEELWLMAHQDALTSTRNRRAFDDYWRTLQDLGRRAVQRPSLRLMLCDINHFKAINDTYGHQIGDAVLTGVADCLHRALRSAETLFRLGGDEFACVLQDCDQAQAVAVARRCEQEMRHYPFAELGLREPVRLSIGISDAAEGPTFSVKDLLRQADMAMYASKRPGSQSITVFEPHMAGEAAGFLSSSANEAVYRAIEHGEGVCMHYQPVLDRRREEVSYYETLLRLEHGGRLIYPNEIFPVVESRHLELEVDRTVIAKVLEDLRSGLVPPGTGASINLSAASIVHDDVVDWLRPLEGLLGVYKLVIEVTETSLIRQMEAASDHLAALRGMGFLVALDDFGSGYSSLRYLTSMPVDIVKFDISLVHALGNPAQHRLVQSLVALIADAGQQVVADGIEDDVMLQRVQEVGFDFVQGYLIGRPAALPAAVSNTDQHRSAG
jgi:diguanylate cyclase (GGDEF)-like protein